MGMSPDAPFFVWNLMASHWREISVVPPQCWELTWYEWVLIKFSLSLGCLITYQWLDSAMSWVSSKLKESQVDHPQRIILQISVWTLPSLITSNFGKNWKQHGPHPKVSSRSSVNTTHKEGARWGIENKFFGQASTCSVVNRDNLCG